MADGTATAFLGLGASLGDRLQNLRDALDRLNVRGVRVAAVSPVYESPHLGLDTVDASRYPPHLNIVARVETWLAPEELLEVAQDVEGVGGRTRTEKWGPRLIDIDILSYDNVEASSERLTLPHPALARRAFVVRPMLDIAPRYRLPDGSLLSDLLQQDPLRLQSIARTDYDLNR